MEREVITVDELHSRFRAQGVGAREDIATKCPICGTVQSGRSLIKAGAGKTLDDVERYIGFSCVGRFTSAGPHKAKAKPGKGCDWSLGGLFKLHKLEVIATDGKRHPYFEVATPDEAQALAESLSASEPPQATS